MGKMSNKKKVTDNDLIFSDTTPLYTPHKDKETSSDKSSGDSEKPANVVHGKTEEKEETEKKPGREKRDPQERVEHMNGVFDRLALPIIIFTVAVFAGFGLLPKLFVSCSSSGTEETAVGAVVSEEDSFFTKRSGLLGNIDKNAELFEEHGYMLVDNEGRTVAYKELENGMEIMENLEDRNGNMYSVVSCTPEGSDVSNVTMMIYSRNLYLVAAKTADGTISAIFESESFSPDVSESDAEQMNLLEIVPRELLASMLTEYKISLSELF